MFRSIIAITLIASAYATPAAPAMRRLANVATTVTICNAIPTDDLLGVSIFDAAFNTISVEPIAFRGCKTSGNLTVDASAGGDGDSLAYAVTRNGTRISPLSGVVYLSTIADQNIAVIAPTATTEGSSSYSPELESARTSAADGYIVTSASYCVGMSAEMTITGRGQTLDSESLDYANSQLRQWSSYPTTGMPATVTVDYTYTPSDGVQAYTAKMTGGQQHGKLGWVTCTGIKGNSGAYAPTVSVFGTAPAGAAAGLAAAVSGWVALAAAAMLAGRRL